MPQFEIPKPPTPRTPPEWVAIINDVVSQCPFEPQLDHPSTAIPLVTSIENLVQEKRLAQPEADLVAHIDEVMKSFPQLVDWERDLAGVRRSARVRGTLAAWREEALVQAACAGTAYEAFPRSEYFRLVIDANRLAERVVNGELPEGAIYQPRPGATAHTRGLFRFDAREPGYLAGGFRGLRAMLKKSKEPLTAEDYKDFHDEIVKAVKADVSSDRPGDAGLLRSGYRTTSSVTFVMRSRKDDAGASDHWYPNYPGVAPLTATPVGLRKLTASVKGTPDSDGFHLKGWCEVYEVDPSKAEESIRRVRLKAVEPEQTPNAELAVRADEVFKLYYDDKERTSEPVRAIARCCQRLDQLHLFGDGNIRTVAFLVLNRLLMNAGQTPTILWEPNCIDGFDLDSLVKQIEIGQGRFRSYAAHPDDPTKWYSYTPDSDPQNHWHAAKTAPSPSEGSSDTVDTVAKTLEFPASAPLAVPDSAPV